MDNNVLSDVSSFQIHDIIELYSIASVSSKTVLLLLATTLVVCYMLHQITAHASCFGLPVRGPIIPGDRNLIIMAIQLVVCVGTVVWITERSFLFRGWSKDPRK